MATTEDGIEMVAFDRGGTDVEEGRGGGPRNIEATSRFQRSSTVNWGKVTPVELSWQNLTSTITVGRRKKKSRTLLNNVSGCVRPGQLLAIMGPSGAGKTTMINILAGRAYGQKIEGELMVNGQKIPNKQFKQFTGYVTQDDVMHSFLTVQEIIDFSATMRLPKSMSEKERKVRVRETITQLGLLKCKHTKIGNAIVRGVSGGERKRVNIGTEMITNPSVLLLDEPTSGLDAFTALNLISLLKEIARDTGQAIVCTIHQPRSDIFNLFDSLLLLGNGETVYFGKASEAVDYFANIGFQCPQFTNPADFFLDLITPDNSNPEAAEAKRKQVDGFCAHYKSTATDTIPNTMLSSPIRKEAKRIGWFSQLFHITKRGLTNDSRNLMGISIRFITAIIMGLIMGSLWFQLGDSQQEIYDRNGFLYFSCLFVGFSELNAAIATFPEERSIFIHEREAGVYRVSSYYLSKVVADTPLRLVAPLIYTCIAYWMVGLRASPNSFFLFLGSLWMISMTTSSMGLTLSSISKNAQIAVALSTTFMIFFMVFAGFFITPDNIPGYYIWLHYISPIKYGFSILLLSQYPESEKFPCREALCEYKTGKDVTDSLGVDVTVYQCFLVLVGMATFLNVSAYLSLRYLNARK